LETFTEPKALVGNPRYRDQRQTSLASLSDDMIDGPIVGLINAFNKLPCCYTLQCCYGHFVYRGQDDRQNVEPLPVTGTVTEVEYRIAYVAFCVENSDSGRMFLEALRGITEIDPENIQFCCAEWFWERHINSYALQVEPERFKSQDTATLDYEEALRIEKTRNAFFAGLEELLRKWQGKKESHSRF
jgi:hypothetical protein